MYDEIQKKKHLFILANEFFKHLKINSIEWGESIGLDPEYPFGVGDGSHQNKRMCRFLGLEYTEDNSEYVSNLYNELPNYLRLTWNFTKTFIEELKSDNS